MTGYDFRCNTAWEYDCLEGYLAPRKNGWKVERFYTTPEPYGLAYLSRTQVMIIGSACIWKDSHVA